MVYLETKLYLKWKTSLNSKSDTADYEHTEIKIMKKDQAYRGKK